MAGKRTKDDLSGDNLLYPYLQRELLTDDIWLFQMLASRLVTALGIWFSPEIYRQLPILLPHVVRDESARGRKSGKEQWAAPTPQGFLRDDNSLIKEIVKSLPIESPRPHYTGRRIGRASGWVAAHVWQLRKDGERASRHHLTNSFVPNLVWLPKDLARLSDRPGSFVQRYLQAISHKLFASIGHPEPLASIVQEAWSQLEIPDIPEQGLPGADQLNFFSLVAPWVEKATLRIESVLQSLQHVQRDGQPVSALRPSRYREGISTLRKEDIELLRSFLASFVGGVQRVKSGP